MADSKLKALKAYLSEAADSLVAGQGDELSALAESVLPEKGLIDKPGFGERFGRNLERRQEARKQMQNEQILAGGLGSLTGTVASPMSRVMSLPARMVTSAAEEVGRSDPESGLEYLKALALGAGQGAMQHVAPGIAAEAVKMRKRSSAKALPFLLDLTQSNASPGLQRQLEADRRQREEEETRARAARNKP
jgi:hypothetical protein